MRQERAAEAQLFRGTLPPPPPAVAPPSGSGALWQGISQLLRFLQSIVTRFLPSVARYEGMETRRE